MWSRRERIIFLSDILPVKYFNTGHHHHHHHGNNPPSQCTVYNLLNIWFRIRSFTEEGHTSYQVGLSIQILESFLYLEVYDVNLYLNISIIFVLVSNKIPRTIQSSSNNPEFPAFYYLQNNNNLNISQTVPPTISVKTRSGQDLIIKIRLSFSPLFCRRSSLINRRVNLRTNSRTY